MKQSKRKRKLISTRLLSARDLNHRKKRTGIGMLRQWLMKHSYAPALLLGIVILASIVVVCVFALPMPETKITESDPIAAAQTEVPESGSAIIKESDIYEELQTAPVTDPEASVLYDAEESTKNVTVYAAEDADCYHLGDCKFAFASSKRLTPYEAYYLGYRACGRCNPPVYNPLTGKTE